MKARRGLVFLLVIAALSANAFVSYRAARTLQENYRWISHTYEVLAVIRRVEPDLTDAENSQRGYIITGEELYLETYRRAVQSVEDGIARFENLTGDNPNQQRRIAEIRAHAERRIASLQKGIDFRRSGGTEEARRFIQSGQGRAEMDALRQILPKPVDEEKRLLGMRDAAAEQSGRGRLWQRV